MAESKEVTTFTRMNRLGELEVVDMISGEILTTERHLEVGARYKYTPDYGRAICSLIAEGRTLSECVRMKGVPPLSILYSWMERYPDFRERLEQARRDRAEVYHDMIISSAEAIEDKESAIVETARINALKWAAERGNPRRYGSKVEVDQRHSGEVGFYVLDTGIRRKKELQCGEDTDTIEGECKVEISEESL